MENNKLISTIGLCRRAGKIIPGSDLVCKELRSGGISLVLLASDASENTKKRITDKTTFYGKRLEILPITCAGLGTAIGKKSDVACVGITDENLASAVLSHIRTH